MMNKNSSTEAIFREEAKKRGWEIFSKGYPDYVIRKDGKLIFVECKRPLIRKTKKMGFSYHQLMMKTLLQSIGADYRVFRGDWEVIEKDGLA